MYARALYARMSTRDHVAYSNPARDPDSCSVTVHGDRFCVTDDTAVTRLVCDDSVTSTRGASDQVSSSYYNRPVQPISAAPSIARLHCVGKWTTGP